MRRAIFYLFYDPEGLVDDYVTHALGHLRQHAEHIFVVSNAELDDVARERLRRRRGPGLDPGERRPRRLGLQGGDGGVRRRATLAGFDEIILMNSTFFGPVGTFDDLFAEMDAREDVDFWGITEHARAKRHPFDVKQPLHAHIQSYWIAVRRAMFTSPEWESYWRDMPMIEDYKQSVLLHESRFTHHFTQLGFRSAVAFPVSRYFGDHTVMDDVVPLLRDGCPIVKRRVFFHDPLYHEGNATDGRQVLRLMAERGFPTEMLLRNLARTAKPRSLVTNLGLLEVLPEVDLGYDRSAPLRVVAVVHMFYPDMTDEVVDRLDHLPGDYDLVITTTRRGEARRDPGDPRAPRPGRRRTRSWRATAAATSRRSSSTAATCSTAATTTSWSRCTRRSSRRTRPTSPSCSSGTCSRTSCPRPGTPPTCCGSSRSTRRWGWSSRRSTTWPTRRSGTRGSATRCAPATRRAGSG